MVTADRHGDWCSVWPGLKFWPDDVRPGDWDMRSIARGLAMKPRFSGHMSRWYSIAEHCVHVSHLVPPEYAREGLLHDATEFLIGDLVRPAKASPLMVGYRQMERQWERALAAQYGLHYDRATGRHYDSATGRHYDRATGWPSDVRYWDDAMLMAEKAKLLDDWSHPWSWYAKPAGVRLRYWSWQRAEREFLARAAGLGLK